MPTCARATSLVRRAKPERLSLLEPDKPRSSSITTTCCLDQPSWQARSARAYWRAVDSRLCSTWPGVDCRMYTQAARSRCAVLILEGSVIGLLLLVGSRGLDEET